MSYTPGPWQVHGSHIYSPDPDRENLAVVINPGERETDYPLVANARLIAAAPELVEALETAITCALRGSVPATSTVEEWSALLARIRGEA